MSSREPANLQWGGQLWMLALIAVVLAGVILLVVIPRPLAWESPLPTPSPGEANPGLFVIPTITPTPLPEPTAAPEPTPASEPTPEGFLVGSPLVS